MPAHNAIIPAGGGADIRCGMMAVKTTLTAGHIADSLAATRIAIEIAAPHGGTHTGAQAGLPRNVV